jgi:hypothetical protein
MYNLPRQYELIVVGEKLKDIFTIFYNASDAGYIKSIEKGAKF